MANIIFHLKNKLNLTILFQIDKQISLEASKSISWLWTLSVVADIMSILYFAITALYFPIKSVKYEAILLGGGIGMMSRGE